jgi:hypothetical protein
MGPEIKIIKGIEYKISTKIVYCNRGEVLNLRNNNNNFCYSMRYSNKLSTAEYNIIQSYNNNFKIHLLHSFISLSKTNITTGHITTILYPITSSPNIINYAKTLINQKEEICEVEKIAESLYIAKNGLIIDFDQLQEKTATLKFHEMIYDDEKDCYVGIKNDKVWNFNNLTAANLKKINTLLFKELSTKSIPKRDITSMVYPEHDLLAYKLLKSGIYSNNEYTLDDIENEVFTLSDKYKYDTLLDKNNLE